MKTISGTFAFIVVAVIAILAAVSFRSFAAGSKTSAVGAHKFKLKIGKTQTDYVDVDVLAFKEALKNFPQDGIDIYYSEKDGAAVQHWPPVPPLSIKTDKVTTSEVAKNASAEDAVANDPNVTRFLSSDKQGDLITVLGTFK